MRAGPGQGLAADLAQGVVLRLAGHRGGGRRALAAGADVQLLDLPGLVTLGHAGLAGGCQGVLDQVGGGVGVKGREGLARFGSGLLAQVAAHVVGVLRGARGIADAAQPADAVGAAGAAVHRAG